ncbi:MAG: hypothetical protein PHW08_15720 [Kiritimatiellae bacterium]|nr:hypothetical protein [Kiritimatiellia bacterium]
MYEFLWDNRQWLFSGLGLAVIAVVWRLILYLLRRGKPAASGVGISGGVKRAPNAEHRTPNFDGADKSVSAQGRQESAGVIQPPSNRPPAFSLSAQEILSQIRALPPLQQEDSFNSYRGTRIRYVGFVNSICKGEGNTAHLELYQSIGRPKVVFSVSLADYPELKQIQQGTPIVAEGALQQLSSSSDFHLVHVLLSHPPDTVAATPGVTMDRTEAYTVLRKMRWNIKLDRSTGDAIEFATWYLFPECHFRAFQEPITPKERRGVVETLAAFKSKLTDSTEQRAIDRALKSLNGNSGIVTDTPPSTP